LATPIADTTKLIGDIAGAGAGGPVLTDVSSVKRPVMHAANQAGLKQFVGGHPMAGSHRAGWAAADEGLLRGAVWALVLDEHTSSSSWADVAEVVLSLGARVAPVSAVGHDRAVAAVSHAAHVAAAAYANSIPAVAPMPLSLVLAAGSFRDVTRVMLSPEERTAAMLIENGDDAAAVASVMSDEVLRLSKALSARDESVVASELARAGELRRRYDRLTATESVTGRLVDAPTRAELVDQLRELVDSGSLVADITDVMNNGAIWRAAVLSPV
jgi:prephenate dehydrogenase